LQYLALSVPVPVAQSAGGAERSQAAPGTDCSAGVSQTPAPDAVQTGRGRLRHGELHISFISEKTKDIQRGYWLCVPCRMTDESLVGMVSAMCAVVHRG